MTLHGGSIVERAEPARRGPRRVEHLLVFSPAGELVATYRKIHRFGFGEGDHGSWTPAMTSSSSTCRWRAATRGRRAVPVLSTCYDLRFPELYRGLVDRGAEVFVVPAAWPAERVAHWTLLGQAARHRGPVRRHPVQHRRHPRGPRDGRPLAGGRRDRHGPGDRGPPG